MHILFISYGDDKYGAPRSMKEFIKSLMNFDKKIKVSVVLVKGSDLESYYRQLGCLTYTVLYGAHYQSIPEQHWKLPFKFLIRGTKYLLGRCGGIYYLNKKLDLDSIDIIHANSSREDLGAMLALRYNKPLIWHIREFRRDYIHFMNSSATKFILVSEAAKAHWINKGLNEDKVIRIYNGISTKINAKMEYINDKDKIKLLMLGCIYEAKGQIQIIEALGLMKEKERKNLVLDIVGGGRSNAYIKKLEKLVNKYGLSSMVNFLGYCDDFSNQICQYDCGIMCSRQEGFGRVTVEYMMAGLPVIASDIAANKELINSETGLLYHVGDIHSLKEKIVYFIIIK